MPCKPSNTNFQSKISDTIEHSHNQQPRLCDRPCFSTPATTEMSDRNNSQAVKHAIRSVQPEQSHSPAISFHQLQQRRISQQRQYINHRFEQRHPRLPPFVRWLSLSTATLQRLVTAVDLLIGKRPLRCLQA
jgi:hypothetical protein